MDRCKGLSSIVSLLALLVFSVNLAAQDFRKMSPLVRRAAIDCKSCRADGRSLASPRNQGSICAFVKVNGEPEEMFAETGCRRLASFGDIHIVDIPLGCLAALSAERAVERIEAGGVCSLCLDTTAVVVDAVDVFSGKGLSHGFDGSGVVMGVMDVGFDLTHPNFRSAAGDLRISRFWDQLSPDSLGSSLYVGADYRTPAGILSYAHSRDGLIETHGTHTLGIASGTGFDTPYRGMAPAADICLVSNAVDTDVPLIPEGLLYKYTTATDALGFKYIFDYASEVGKPCVISFSEGSHEGIDGEQQLFYEVLSRMTGPGRIIVASAGNNGYYNTFLHKPAGMETDGMFLSGGGQKGSLTLVSGDSFSISLSLIPFSSGETAVKTFSVADIVSAEDSLLVDSVVADAGKCVYRIQAYEPELPSCATAYDIVLDMPGGVGGDMALTLRITGSGADVRAYSNGLTFFKYELDETLSGGEAKYSVLSPGSAPCVVCVGATTYRDSFVNVDGETKTEIWGHDGTVGKYSSVGPTRQELVKPDVVAPGTCVRSSLSSYYIEDKLSAGEQAYGLMRYSAFEGRSYGWGAQSGTSMSAPVVGGAIALWLQANPSLSPDDIFGILSETSCRSRSDNPTGKSNSWGYGEIDVYAGLVKALALDGIEGISSRHPSAVELRHCGDGTVRFSLAGGEASPGDLHLYIYNTSGKLLRKSPLLFSQGQSVVSLADLPLGVYALQIVSPRAEYCGSFLVRR